MAFSEVISNDWQSCLFSGSLKLSFARNEAFQRVLSDKIPSDCLGYFDNRVHGFLLYRPAILKVEKALVTRLTLLFQPVYREGGGRGRGSGERLYTGYVISILCSSVRTLSCLTTSKAAPSILSGCYRNARQKKKKGMRGRYFVAFRF